jgi:superfamily II DNA or RNA helicase
VTSKDAWRFAPTAWITAARYKSTVATTRDPKTAGSAVDLRRRPEVWARKATPFMAREDRVIASCATWDAFFSATCTLPTTAQQGAAFERLTQLYLRTQPEYQSLLADVWQLSEVPAKVREELRLTKVDEGIDLIARTRDGDYWAIQCKFRTDKNHRLTRRELSTFTSLSFHTCRGISLAVVAHTCAKPVKKHDLLPNTVEIGLERWLQLTEGDWSRIKSATAGRIARPVARSPRPHQIAAIEAADKHFVKGGASRGRLIMPCGTGKSLTAFWIAQALSARTILVAVPSLALIRQSLTDWTREYLAAGVVPEWLVVCSDDSTGNLDRDEFVGATYDLGIPTTTDAAEIAAFLKRDARKHKIVFTTYQSGSRLAQGAKRADYTFDLGIFDEAHKTVGVKSKAFAALLFESNVAVRRRVFMTATERVLSGRNDDVLSMDDPSTYGDRFFLLSFKQAIGEKLISDYRIVTITVSDERVQQLIEDRRLLDIGTPESDEADAQSLAAGIALKRTYEKYRVRHAISFHRSIRSATQFAEQQATLNEIDALGPRVTSLHVSSKRSAGERADLMRTFADTDRALLTNARCLTEGVDIPAIDCVLFADPKQSTIDIVQAAGRALRKFEGKEYGYIVLPLIVPPGMAFDEFAETTEFRQVAKTIAALSVQDERIAEQFRAVDRSRKPSGQLVTIEGDVPVGMRIEAGDFAARISTRVWEQVGRANWRSFEDARRHVRSLGIKTVGQWYGTCDLPPDIPRAPDVLYRGKGWLSWGDWLGTGTVSSRLRRYREFSDARAYARSLGLKSYKDWKRFASTEGLPQDIPIAPHLNPQYRQAGWISWGDWLGTGSVGPGLKRYRAFKEARDFARSLNLKSSADWYAYAKSGRLPLDIPADPRTHYVDEGWKDMGDWLGTGVIAPQFAMFRPFADARSFVHALRLKTGHEWRIYCRSKRRPVDIPTNPNRVYANDGWAGMGDWLGTGAVAKSKQEFMPFAEAREFVRKLALKNNAEWREYSRSGRRPADIPGSPEQTYADDGWNGYGDWLGTGAISYRNRRLRSFSEARSFVHTLGLKNQTQWVEYAKSDLLPVDIPRAPEGAYRNKGWKGIGDWLGTGTVAARLREYRSFAEAREFVRKLGLKNQAEWNRYVKSHQLPTDIPASPQTVYGDKGWRGIGDWLGTGIESNKHRTFRSFESARAFVRTLGLRSALEWEAYSRSGDRPADIPSNPQRHYRGKGWQGVPDWLGFA